MDKIILQFKRNIWNYVYGLSGLPVRLSSLGYHLRTGANQFELQIIIKIVCLINNNFFVNKLTIIYKVLQES